MPFPCPWVVAVSIACSLFAILESPAQNLLQNGDFENDAAAIAGATGDGSASPVDSRIDFWNVDVRGSGDYAFLSTIGTFQGGGGGNLNAGVDLAAFQLAGGGPAAFSGSYHIDVIGAALGEVSHVDQRLNSVLNQTVSGLSIGVDYNFTYHYSITDYNAEPREMGVRIDPEVGGVPDQANNIYNNLINVGFAPTDPAGIVTVAQRERFELAGPVPTMDYTTIGPLDLDDSVRTIASNALSATTTFDEVAGSGEAPVVVNWQTVTVNFTATASTIRVSFFNNSDPFQQDEADYHYRTAADGMGKHDIWFGHEVGLLLDDVSLTLVPEPGAITLLVATALFFMLRRSARKYSESPLPPAKVLPKP